MGQRPFLENNWFSFDLVGHGLRKNLVEIDYTELLLRGLVIEVLLWIGNHVFHEKRLVVHEHIFWRIELGEEHLVPHFCAVNLSLHFVPGSALVLLRSLELVQGRRK